MIVQTLYTLGLANKQIYERNKPWESLCKILYFNLPVVIPDGLWIQNSPVSSLAAFEASLQESTEVIPQFTFLRFKYLRKCVLHFEFLIIGTDSEFRQSL